MRNGKWGNEETGKWGNGEMRRRYIAFHSANCWHFVTTVIKGKSMSMHALIESSLVPRLLQRKWAWGRGYQEIIFAWQLAPKGYATALHHSLQANSMYKFFTFGSLLAISWIYELSILCSKFIQGAILKLLHAVACIVMDIHIFVSHTAL